MQRYKEIGPILRRIRRDKLWTLSYTCGKAGDLIDSGNLSRIERGETIPNLVAGYKLAEALEVRLEDIFAEVEGRLPKPQGFEQKVPVLSWVQAGAMCSSPAGAALTEPEEWIIAPRKGISKNAYALTVSGDSMQSLSGMSFPDGCQIIVDPDKAAEHRSYVIAMTRDTEESTFKQLMIDGGRKYLKPLNPQYPIINTTEDMIICGVVTDMVAKVT